MSAQEPTYVMRPQRIRNDNAQSFGGGGISSGMKDLLITGAALGVGALGGYFLLDYIFKGKLFDINGTPPASGDDIELASDDVESGYIAHTLPYDRTTRVNSYGNTGISAYRGEKVLPRLPVVTQTDPYETDVDDEVPAFNQVFTDDEVIEVT